MSQFLTFISTKIHSEDLHQRFTLPITTFSYFCYIHQKYTFPRRLSTVIHRWSSTLDRSPIFGPQSRHMEFQRCNLVKTSQIFIQKGSQIVTQTCNRFVIIPAVYLSTISRIVIFRPYSIRKKYSNQPRFCFQKVPYSKLIPELRTMEFK